MPDKTPAEMTPEERLVEIGRLKAEVNKLTSINAKRLLLESRKLELEHELAQINADLASLES